MKAHGLLKIPQIWICHPLEPTPIIHLKCPVNLLKICWLTVEVGLLNHLMEVLGLMLLMMDLGLLPQTVVLGLLNHLETLLKPLNILLLLKLMLIQLIRI